MSDRSIRTLFITKEIPYPPRGGVSLRNWQNLNILKKYGPVAVFSAANWTPKETSLPGIALWQHCNVEQQRTPWENRQRHFWWLFPHRHPDVDWAYSAQAAGELRKLLANFKPDLVILSQVWLYRYLKVVKSYPCVTILDQHNVEAHLFEQQDFGAENFLSRLKAKLLLSHLQGVEGQFSRQVDAIWTCSERDAHLIEELYGKVAPTQVIPNGLDLSYYAPVRSRQANLPPNWQPHPHTLVFVGLLSYPPNREAAELLVEQIYPHLQADYPDCRLLVVGRNPTQRLQEAAGEKPGVTLTGGVGDVRPYLAAASAVVVPLLQGGGTRLKILEAFAAGLPVVSTAKGAEGLAVTDAEQLLIREGVEGIVAGICQLWSNPALREKLTAKAYELVRSEYSWEAVGQRVNTIIKELILIEN